MNVCVHVAHRAGIFEEYRLMALLHSPPVQWERKKGSQNGYEQLTSADVIHRMVVFYPNIKCLLPVCA